MTARTLNEVRNTPGASFAYWGERGDWAIAYTIHRDSDALERSNFKALRADMEAECDADDWAVETCGHWLVGHLEHLLARPGTRAEELANEARERLEVYPVLDEEAFSEEEREVALDSAATAFRCYGYGWDKEESEAAAPFILDAAGEEPYNCGMENWYPERPTVFRGVLAYRRWERKQKQAS